MTPIVPNRIGIALMGLSLGLVTAAITARRKLRQA